MECIGYGIFGKSLKKEKNVKKTINKQKSDYGILGRLALLLFYLNLGKSYSYSALLLQARQGGGPSS